MEFIAEKDAGLIPYVLSQILDTCVNGITLSDPDQEDNPIVYANEAFEMITGYSREEILGKNGELFYNNFSIRPLLDREGRLLYFLGVQYDITNQVEAEQELNRLNQLLRQT